MARSDNEGEKIRQQQGSDPRLETIQELKEDMKLMAEIREEYPDDREIQDHVRQILSQQVELIKVLKREIERTRIAQA